MDDEVTYDDATLIGKRRKKYAKTDNYIGGGRLLNTFALSAAFFGLVCVAATTCCHTSILYRDYALPFLARLFLICSIEQEQT